MCCDVSAKCRGVRRLPLVTLHAIHLSVLRVEHHVSCCAAQVKTMMTAFHGLHNLLEFARSVPTVHPCMPMPAGGRALASSI